jgi:hypothetical protein
MTGWFNPKLARKAFAASRCVGSVRAVRRPETHCAALDPVKTGTTFDISPGEDGARGSIWIDYAADLGDGFDATICSFFTQASTARW